MLRHCRFTTGSQRPRNILVRDGKMYVPSDSFGGISPERKASQALQSLFTFVSAKVVLAQLEGSGRGALASYNREQYQVLFSHLQEASLSDSHAWLEQLMRKDKALALRLMEVRAAYSRTDFEWDQLQRLSVESIQKSNLQLMREAATASLQATTAAAAAGVTTGPIEIQERPAEAATVQAQTREQQQVQEQDQQEQPVSAAPAAEATTNEAELEQTLAPGTGNSSSSSSSTESADALDTGAADPEGQAPSSSGSTSQEQQQQEQQQEQQKQQ